MIPPDCKQLANWISLSRSYQNIQTRAARQNYLDDTPNPALHICSDRQCDNHGGHKPH